MTETRETHEILLVEDSPSDRLLALRALGQMSVPSRVHSVEDGEEALAFLRQEGTFALAKRPDLILLDLNLPRKDGRQVLTEIKGDPLLCCIPVVVLTTSNAESDVLEAYSRHCNGYARSLSVMVDYWFNIMTLPP
jgi:CheY-like chemotaxis protein